MIVDVHTHTPSQREPVPEEDISVNRTWRPDRPVVSSVSWSDYTRDTQSADVTIVFNIAVRSSAEQTGLPVDRLGINDATAVFVRAAPDRRIGFLSVHPEAGDAVEELERCVAELGLRGIKLGANYQRFEPLGKPARVIYGIAERRGLPIIFHQGTSPIRDAPLAFAHPLVIDEVAMAFPELRMVIAHMAHPWQADALMVIRKHPHVYADVSSQFFRPWAAYNAFTLATEWGVLGKLVLGSDYPIATPAETIAGLRAVNDVVAGTRLPRVPSAEIEAIINRDSLQLLGLERPKALIAAVPPP